MCYFLASSFVERTLVLWFDLTSDTEEASSISLHWLIKLIFSFVLFSVLDRLDTHDSPSKWWWGQWMELQGRRMIWTGMKRRTFQLIHSRDDVTLYRRGYCRLWCIVLWQRFGLWRKRRKGSVSQLTVLVGVIHSYASLFCWWKVISSLMFQDETSCESFKKFLHSLCRVFFYASY
jgi:hypothetical protein